MAEQAASIGRVVHFVYGDQHYAAMITAVSSRMIAEAGPAVAVEGQTLIVFPPMERPFSTIARLDPAFAPGTWHWPEYVPAKESQ